MSNPNGMKYATEARRGRRQIGADGSGQRHIIIWVDALLTELSIPRWAVLKFYRFPTEATNVIGFYEFSAPHEYSVFLVITSLFRFFGFSVFQSTDVR